MNFVNLRDKKEYNDFTYNIIKEFFNKKFLKHHIESYNDFVLHGIKKIFSEEPEIIVPLENVDKYSNFFSDTTMNLDDYMKENLNTEEKNSLPENRYVVSFDNVYLPKARIINDDRSFEEITPSLARKKDICYDTPLLVDIIEKFYSANILTTTNIHRRVCIARIPVMVGSVLCNISSDNNECKYEPGGYFIMKGVEHVLVTIRRDDYNCVKTFDVRTKNSKKCNYYSEIRSMSKSTAHSSLFNIEIGEDDRTITVRMPRIKKNIHLGILLKALGFTNTKNYGNLLSLDESNSKIKKYLNYIIRDSCFIRTKEEALIYISSNSVHIMEEEDYVDYAKQLVENELFPHLGINPKKVEIISHISHVFQKLIKTVIGERSVDDIDHLSLKRFENAGILLYDLTKILIKRFIKILTKKSEKKQDVILNCSKIANITSGLKSSISTGKWGAQNNDYPKEGVSQLLSRFSFISLVSHLTRIMIPTRKESKNLDIKQLRTNSIFSVCCCETPEGQHSGVVLNLALGTTISGYIDYSLTKESIDLVEYIKIENLKTKNLIDVKDYTKIFLNGQIIGFTNEPEDFVSSLRQIRRNGELHPFVSICYDFCEDEIKIFSDEGRIMRIIFDLEQLDIDKINKNYNFEKMIKENIIVYRDINELEFEEIAMSVRDIDDNPEVMYGYLEINPVLMLGATASTVAFIEHNQAPRNIYQCAMGKQAIGIPMLSHRTRTDTTLHCLDYPQKPLIRSKMSEITHCDEMPTGINAIVMISTYKGFDQEDSIIMNKNSIERGLFRSTEYKTISCVIKKKDPHIECVEFPPLQIRRKDLNYALLGENAIIKSGTYVKRNDILVGKVLYNSKLNDSSNPSSLRDVSVFAKKGEEGVIDRVYYYNNSKGMDIIKIVIRKIKIPQIGDKCVSGNAQKGTIGLVAEQIDLPTTIDGITPDIIINPNCIPSRMTIGQLIGCLMGKISCCTGEFGDSSAFCTNYKDIMKFTELLHSLGFESTSRERMINGETGELMDAMMFIGPTYYHKLKHMVEDKIHSRRKGKVTMFYRQPNSGRKNDGSCRTGEMEVACLDAHGNSQFIHEKMFTLSDNFVLYVCVNCGEIKTGNTCRLCGNDEFGIVDCPYASKILFQELNGLSIKTSFFPKI